MTEIVSDVLFNPFTEEHRSDPYPQYQKLRDEDPVHRSPFGIWVLSRHADVEAVLRGPRFKSIGPYTEGEGLAGAPAPDPDRDFTKVRSLWIVFQDGAAHTRLRRLMNKVFTPRAVARLVPRIRARVDELMEGPLAAGEMDVIAELAYPLPATVICELLGIPEADRESNREWAEAVAPTFDPVVAPDKLDAAQDAMDEWAAYFRALVDERRDSPEDGLLDDFIAVEDAGDGMATDEIVANSTFLFGAGHETTTNLIGNGMLALVSNPDQLEVLRRRPELIGPAVEELLRFDAPVQMTARTCEEDVTIGEFTIPAGEPMALLLGAANRDPDVYPEPDRLDVGRDVEHLLGFGSGAHYCLGAALARIEARLAFEALITNTAEITLSARELSWRPMLNLRGLESLAVELVD